MITKTDIINDVKRHSSVNPEKIALYYRGVKVTYSAFIKTYSALANFINNNISAWNRIGVLIDDDLKGALTAMPIIDHAVLIQLDSTSSVHKLSELIDLLKIDYILTDSLSFKGIEIIRGKGIGIIKITFSESYDIEEIEYLSELKAGYEKRNMKWTDLVSIKTTSGTTSVPKIVPITGKMYMSSARRYIKTFNHNELDIVLISTRIFKTLAFSTIARVLATGGSAIIMGSFSPADFIEILYEKEVTCFAAPTAVLSALAQYIEKNGIKPVKNKLRYARSSGAPLPFKLKMDLEIFFGITVDQSYGMTETYNIAGTHNQPKGYRKGSAGVSNGLDVKILNGEIMVRGESVFSGYLNDEIDNNEYFTDGWFHTGDLGEIDSDGYIYVKGRLKEMINRGGEKISPYEVEKAIMELTGINDAVVFPYPNIYGSENAGAVVVTNIEDFALDKLRSGLKGIITAYKMPTLLYIVDEIPIGDNGKVQRRELYKILKEKYPQKINKSKKASLKNLSKTEKSLFKIWEKVLKCNIKDKYATFSDLGGDSLNGAEVLSEIENLYNIKLPVDFLYDEGTLEDIADYIDKRAGKASEFKFLTPVNSSGSKKPLIFVHTVTGDATTYRYIGKAMELDRPVYALSFNKNGFAWPQPLDFDSIAGEYIKELIKLDPAGPYYLCGHCWGGVLAFKLACELKKMNKEIAMLAMLDSPEKLLLKRDGRVSSSFIKRFIITLIEGLKELRRHAFKDAIKLFYIKLKNIPNLYKQVQSRKFYAFAVKHKIQPLIKICNTTGALGYAYSRYKPQKFNGRITYFKAQNGRVSNAINHTVWEKMADDFKLVLMDCEHNDFITKEFAYSISEALRSEMESADA